MHKVFGIIHVSAIRKFSIAAMLVASVGLIANSVSASSQNASRAAQAAPSQSDLDSGKESFNGLCSGCHGLDATGGQAPNIQRAPATLGDDGVAKIIKSGLPGTGMPAFAGLTDVQAKQIIAYIRSLASATASGKASQISGGDPVRGKAIYATNACADCHTISGTGGNLGPELSQIGTLRTPDYIRSALLDPGANLPKTGRVARDRGMWTAYLVFRAVGKNGEAVEGMRVSEDSFDIVLEDSKGNLHSFHKPDLRSLEKEPTKSFMPSFKTVLSPADLDNLVAYLAGLKGAQ